MSCLMSIIGLIMVCSGCGSCVDGDSKYGMVLVGIGFLLIYAGTKDD